MRRPALLSPTVPNGAYVVDCEPTDTSPASKDVANRQALWEWTDDWIKSKLAAFDAPAEAAFDCVDEEECGLPSD